MRPNDPRPGGWGLGTSGLHHAYWWNEHTYCSFNPRAIYLPIYLSYLSTLHTYCGFNTRAPWCFGHHESLTLTPLSQPQFDYLCSPVTSAGCCPINWQFYGSNCFYFSEEGMSWDSARDYCSRESSSLVILKDAEKWVCEQIGVGET